jgi:hypothetical protein
MGKLTRIHVVAIALSIAIVLGLGWYFAMMKPVKENIATTLTSISNHEKTIHGCITSLPADDAEPLKTHDGFETKLKSASDSKFQKDLEDARAENDKLRKQLNYFKGSLYVVDFTKDEGESEEQFQQRAWRAVMREFHDVIKPEFDEFIRGGGVPVSANFQPDTPPAIWTAIKAPSSSFIKMPSGGQIEVQVQGTYGQIISFLNYLTTWNRLIGVGTVKLSGQSPFITAAFPISVYILADIPEDVLSAAASAGAGAGGMMGGMDMMGGMGGAMSGMEGMTGAAGAGGPGIPGDAGAGAAAPPAPSGGGGASGDEDVSGGRRLNFGGGGG